MTLLPITVMLVDDQADTRESFATILGYQPDIEVIAQASDGLDALTQHLKRQAQVIVMDIRMPRLDGISATRQLLAQDPAAKVLMLTTFDIDDYARSALDAGAAGFLLKDVTPTQLADGIRAVAKGDAVLTPRITRMMLSRSSWHSQNSARQQKAIARLARLTERELELVDLIADGLNNAEIAEALVLSPETVKTYVKRLLVKLDLRDRVQIVICAHDANRR